jgi:diaminohydroxyphosphoribosylaminopyrimidine deaminase/5-amino-6-(5-phosphoribosylamino)uracil reductase
VIVRDGRTLGEGWHHRKGEPHAEAEALRAVREGGGDPRGATMYVTLEPHDHQSTMPPCSVAIVEAQLARVVVGTLDPNPLTHGRGVARMRGAGIDVEVVDDAASCALIERFAFGLRAPMPFVTLKMAMSLDGYVAPAAVPFPVTGPQARAAVHALRAAHDAVMVGAGTVRVDDPLLTVRPHRSRRAPYARVVVCETGPISPDSRVLRAPADAPPHAYRPTIVTAPAGAAARFATLAERAELVLVGGPDETQLDLPAALGALRERGLTSILCEGGPTLAGRLLAAGLVQRLIWLIAPRFLRAEGALPVLAGADLRALGNGWEFERVERVGDDLMLTARRLHHV